MSAPQEKKGTAISPSPKSLLRNTFSTSYLVLAGYTIVTLVEALRTKSADVRHIMNIETAVSLVAGFVYGQFQDLMKQPIPDFEQIMQLRYVDWSITTPLILLALLLFYNGSGNVTFSSFVVIALLNYGMLGFGYMGETGRIDKFTGSAIGFAFFAAMLFMIWNCCMGKLGHSLIVFFIFAILWTLYGVAYWLDDENKNIMYNLLDVCSKALFGMALWLYFGKVLKF